METKIIVNEENFTEHCTTYKCGKCVVSQDGAYILILHNITVVFEVSAGFRCMSIYKIKGFIGNLFMDDLANWQIEIER